MVAITTGIDVTSTHFSILRLGVQGAGYTTGSADIRWTPEMWAQFPDAVRIDQDAGASDHTADVLDVETGAATVAECAAWKTRAQAAFEAGTRPGQREPAIYCSASMITPVVNALVAGGVTGCPLWVAHFGIGMNSAMSMLNASAGPYPIIGVQYADNGSYDSDVWLTSWLQKRSAAGPPKPQVPPGQWGDPRFWSWQDAVIAGTGLDGRLHIWTFDPAAGDWSKAE